MDESAIRLIQQTAIAAATNAQERVPSGTLVLPEDHSVRSLEQFQLHRSRFRGTMSTNSLADFVSYVSGTVERSDVALPEGYIDQDSLTAVVMFNLWYVVPTTAELVAGHADWRAELQLKPTAAYAGLLAVEGKPLTQRQVIEWLEDWQRQVTHIYNDDGNQVVKSAAIDAIRKIDIKAKKDTQHVDENRRAARTVMEEIEAQAGDNMPDLLHFLCEPCPGLATREFIVRLSVLTNQDEPRLKMRIAEKEAHIESIGQEFKTVLERALGDTVPLTLGAFDPQ